MPWGLFPVKNKIPLVTETKDESLVLEGTAVTGRVCKHSRRVGGQQTALGVGPCSAVPGKRFSCLLRGKEGWRVSSLWFMVQLHPLLVSALGETLSRGSR